MNLLLHICCAPCVIFPIDELKRQGNQVAGFFYNPNIHPYSEYLRRKSEVEKYAKEVSINIIYSDYEIEKYFQHIIYNEVPNKRCPICWWLRLEKTAQVAKENGFDSFTTTLLGSPYQDGDTIKTIGEDIAKRLGLNFPRVDFRLGFKEAHNTARLKGMYCQNYCGCVFSEKERIEAKSST